MPLIAPSPPPLSACPSLSSSVSSAASPPEVPSLSRSPSSSSVSSTLNRRGYVRPQGASFAPSAGGRESVLSLGSIAHLQYYFARTGLLDGKGAQLATDDRGKIGAKSPKSIDEPVMLPPTVSTYAQRLPSIPSPPDMYTLQHDLVVSLQDARHTLQILDPTPSPHDPKSASPSREPSAWHQIQGTRVLDVITTAIKTAKSYYTSHHNPQRLYSIRSERAMREDLLLVMDTLKRMAGRNFAGGLRSDEIASLESWLTSVDRLIDQEMELERQEEEQRAAWIWAQRDLWLGRERDREWCFLRFLHPDFPELEALRTGVDLVKVHNSCVRKSRRPFGEITSFHTNTLKPYRCAENLRFWAKAAELRWEVKLQLSIPAILNRDPAALADFDAAILQWARTMRHVLVKD